MGRVRRTLSAVEGAQLAGALVIVVALYASPLPWWAATLIIGVAILGAAVWMEAAQAPQAAVRRRRQKTVLDDEAGG